MTPKELDEWEREAKEHSIASMKSSNVGWAYVSSERILTLIKAHRMMRDALNKIANECDLSDATSVADEALEAVDGGKE